MGSSLSSRQRASDLGALHFAVAHPLPRLHEWLPILRELGKLPSGGGSSHVATSDSSRLADDKCGLPTEAATQDAAVLGIPETLIHVYPV